jgi:hypothetical protein
MSRLVRLAVILCIAASAIALSASAASALRSISITIRREITAEGAFSFEEGGGFLRVVCSSKTLELELTSTAIAKVDRLPTGKIGSILKQITSRCRAFGFFEATVELETPVEISYNSFLGTLPVITVLRTAWLLYKLKVTAAGRTCRYTGSPRVDLTVNEREEISGTSSLPEPRLRLVIEGSTAECPRQGEIRSALRFTSPIRIRLI